MSSPVAQVLIFDSYGEQGSVIIFQVLSNLFPTDGINPDRVAPLTPTEFLQLILVPECAVALIQDDLGPGATIERAIRTLRDSSKYGTAMFPDLDISGGRNAGEGIATGAQWVGEAIVKERVRARRKEIDEEERMEEEKEKSARKSSRAKETRKATQSDVSDAVPKKETSKRDSGKKTKGRSNATKQKRDQDESALEVSDSSALQSEASKASWSRKGKSRLVAEVSDRARPANQRPTSKFRTGSLQPRNGHPSEAVCSDLFAESEPDLESANEATPRPRIRVRTPCTDSDHDLDIVLPKVDNRFAKVSRDKSTETKSSRKINNGASQPLKAAKARKANE